MRTSSPTSTSRTSVKRRTSRRAPVGTTTSRRFEQPQRRQVADGRSGGVTRAAASIPSSAALSSGTRRLRCQIRVPKDGVGQQADPVQLDQYGRVPDVEESAGDGLSTPSKSLPYHDPLTTTLVRLHPIGVIETPADACDNALMRMVAARILAVLGVIFALVSLLAGYVRFQGLDTDTVTGTAGDLIADEQIRNQVAASLVDRCTRTSTSRLRWSRSFPPIRRAWPAPSRPGCASSPTGPPYACSSARACRRSG